MTEEESATRPTLQDLASGALDEGQLRRIFTGLGGRVRIGPRRLAGFIVPIPGHALTETAVRQQLVEVLPLSLVPSVLAVVSSIPRTTNGKVDRLALSALIESGVGEARVSDPTSQEHTEEDALRMTIEASWRQAIGLDADACVDHFFRAGGSSLAAMRSVSALSRELDVTISLVELFRQPAISDFTAHVRGLTSSARTTGVR